MSIPFFSIDLTFKDYGSLLLNILLPLNKRKLKNKIKKDLAKKYPNRFISLLPSGRLGFYLTMKFLFKPNDLIIFSSMSFPLYIKIAKQLQLKVKLVDVSEKDLNINPEKLEMIEDDCKGIVITHLFGNPCNVEKIKEICLRKNLILIEDCAQSFNSKYNKIETGNFGEAGIVSTSLLKIPTTLSGGILVTKNEQLHHKVEKWCEDNLSNNIVDKFKLSIKILLFILNSYPKIYSILSDKIFSFLKNYNPRIYRKVLYSGMGMKKIPFNPIERPNLTKFQLAIGLSQIKRCDEMNLKRKENSQYLQKKLSACKNIKVINNHFKEDWNHQYFVILVKENFEEITNKIFRNGIHAMDENVWDCSNYNFEINNENTNFEITKYYNGKLLRIQNNSLLTLKEMDKISETLINASNKK
jgi:dTDP-4-amino-4,6-dideoxygalactose transaminase